ncbi:MAG TPA: sortase [Candidatus Limnocylindrales bacterium]|nr:sortase [Candidatus Limnocylindrales bacterium]
MTSLSRALRHRLLPAVLTAAGVTLIAAGLLSYSGRAFAGDEGASPTATIVRDDPGATLPVPTLPPLSASPSAAGPSPTPNASRVATRVVVEALGIDLPVVKPSGDSNTYPACNVAMYLQDPRIGQPGWGRATYLYAHARDGMFGPIYQRAIERRSGGPNSLKGMLVEVYTNDDYVFEYEITEVRLHQTSLDAPLTATSEQLWLQTSEGPKGTKGKTQVLAKPLVVLPAEHKAANPVPHPVVCG